MTIIRSIYEACTCLYSIINWGLLQPSRLQGSTMSHLFIHTKATQVWVAFLPSSLPVINFWWDTPSEIDSDDEKDDFPSAELDDPVWSEEPIPNRQQLCIHQIPRHTPRQASSPPQCIQEVLPEPEQMISRYWMTYQMSTVFPENFPDFDSWAYSVLEYSVVKWHLNMGSKHPMSEDHYQTLIDTIYENCLFLLLIFCIVTVSAMSLKYFLCWHQ